MRWAFHTCLFVVCFTMLAVSVSLSMVPVLFAAAVLPLCRFHSFSREFFKPMIPKVLEWGREYRFAQFKGDFMSACTIAAVAVPQGLAYARLAEVEPVHGQSAVLHHCRNTFRL